MKKRSALFFILLMFLCLTFSINVNASENIVPEMNYADDSSASYSSGSSSGDNNQYLDIGTRLPYSVDYSNSQLLEYVKKGDILFDEIGKPIIPNVDTGHIAIVEGIFFDSYLKQYYIRTIEANPESGVARGMITPDRFANNMMILRVEDVSASEIDQVVDLCIT